MTVHPTTHSMSSKQTATSPKSVGLTRRALSTSPACVGQKTPPNPCHVRTRTSLEWRSFLARAIGNLQMIFWDLVFHFSYRKFYIPHHPHSLKWKTSGSLYACTTESVKGSVAILEPAIQRASPQLKIFDPLFRVGTSRPQRMHNGLPLSLLDFLLVTAMLLVTPGDEWLNVKRTNPSESIPDSSHRSFPSVPSDTEPLLPTSEATPAIERWRSAIPVGGTEGTNRSQCGESSDGQTSSSPSTSRLSFHTDTQLVTQHSTYPSGQGPFSTYSTSSLSLASHAQLGRRRTRELPVPPLPSHGPSGRNPPSASSYGARLSYIPHGGNRLDELPPIPPLPGSSSGSQHDPRSTIISSASLFSHGTTDSPTSIHSRSLPIPPTPSSPKPRLPLLPLISAPNSAVITSPISPLPLPGPVPSATRRSQLLRSRSHAHLRNTVPYPNSPHDHKPLAKAPPNYTASTHDLPPPLPITSHGPIQREAISRTLSIRTTGVTPVLSAGSASAGAASADTSLAFEEVDPYDLPPAYSSLDATRSQLLRLRAANGDVRS
ncbi:hypothetical protein BC826DRAFT_91650 [Russula brevipes]|nr:hypothetical protein BC826DRAFT_91650 [Russula brevipes]